MRRDKVCEVETGFNQDTRDLSAAGEPIKRRSAPSGVRSIALIPRRPRKRAAAPSGSLTPTSRCCRCPAAQLGVVELFEQSACVDDTDAVGQMCDLGEDVARHEDGHAVLVNQPPEQLADLDDPGRVETIGRFIEDEQLGAMEQRTGERETLFVAQRELPGPTFGRF